jgi:hypothetical protein
MFMIETSTFPCPKIVALSPGLPQALGRCGKSYLLIVIGPFTIFKLDIIKDGGR